MSRNCQCRNRCRHSVRGSSDPLLSPDQLAGLESVLGTLVDAADAFDRDGSLTINPECDFHGIRPESNPGCVCVGVRYSAAEFVAALQLDVRSAALHLPRGIGYARERASST